jgi:hypothetical protein
MNNHPLHGNDFSESFDLFVYSDPNGLWINHKNKDLKFVYQLPPSWDIEFITIDEASNRIYFTEVYCFDFDKWFYSNVRAVPIDRTYTIETVASTARRMAPGVSAFSRHYPSPDGNFLVLKRDSMEFSCFDLYKKVERNWMRLKVPTERDHQRFLGWSQDSKKIYLSREDTGSKHMEGMFVLDVESLEVQQVNELDARIMDPEKNMFLTLPYGSLYRPNTIEFREIDSGDLIKSVDYQCRGLKLWNQIQWHPSLPVVLIPERSTDGRKPSATFISTISPIDSLNYSMVLPGRITQFQWMNNANSFLYVFEGDLCRYSFETEEFEKITGLKKRREDIETFAIKWKE